MRNSNIWQDKLSAALTSQILVILLIFHPFGPELPIHCSLHCHCCFYSFKWFMSVVHFTPISFYKQKYPVSNKLFLHDSITWLRYLLLINLSFSLRRDRLIPTNILKLKYRKVHICKTLNLCIYGFLLLNHF